MWLLISHIETPAFLGAYAGRLVLAGLLSGPVTSFMWLPMLLFEVGLALWLIIKGAGPVPRHLA